MTSPGYSKDDDGKVTLDCPTCGGTGKHPNGFIGALCPDCNGTGKKKQPHGSRKGSQERGSAPLQIGTKTQWGKIGAVLMTKGERYYMMTRGNNVSLMPASVVEGEK